MNQSEQTLCEINLLDDELVELLSRRLQAEKRLAKSRKAQGLPVSGFRDDEAKRADLEKKLEEDEYRDLIKEAFESVLSAAKQVRADELFGVNLYLTGFMGAGKSTISSALRDLFGMDVIEMDEIIALRNGMSIPEIFEKHGEEYFRAQESALLHECGEGKNLVISCGGGVVKREENVREMKKNGLVVLLEADPDTILERVRDSHDRPLLENNKTTENIAKMMEERRPAYEAAADIRILTTGKSPEEICEEIAAAIGNLKDEA